MNKMLMNKKLVAALVAAVLAVVALGAAAGYVWSRHDRLPSNAVLRYDGRTITKQQLDARVDVLAALYGVQRPQGSKVATFNRDAAKSMAVSLILAHEARERGIVISGKQARDELDKLVQQQLSGGQEAFTQFLAANGLSENDVLGEIKEQLATSRLAEQVTAQAKPVTTSAAQAVYEAHKSQMVSPESRHLLNIVVASKTDAQRVLKKARNGADFGALAGTWSQDGSTKDKGGDLGTVTADQLDAGYAKAAFAAEKGGVFGPVQTQYGWNVGKVAGITASVPVDFATIKDTLVSGLEDKEKLDLWNGYLKRLLQQAHVEYADAYRPAHPTALPSAPASGSVATATPSAGQ
jgi:peptidyl-prolyl cis-trans isomerase C